MIIRVVSQTKAVPGITLPVAEERPATGGRIPFPEGFFNAGSLADGQGVIANRAKTESADIVRLWIPQEVKSLGNFAFKGCPNLVAVICEDRGGGAPLLPPDIIR